MNTRALRAPTRSPALSRSTPKFGGALLDRFNDLEQARKAAEEDYCGCHASLADYAQELTEETSSIPRHLAMYIDYRAMACDMEYSGDVFTWK